MDGISSYEDFLVESAGWRIVRAEDTDSGRLAVVPEDSYGKLAAFLDGIAKTKADKAAVKRALAPGAKYTRSVAVMGPVGAIPQVPVFVYSSYGEPRIGGGHGPMSQQVCGALLAAIAAVAL